MYVFAPRSRPSITSGDIAVVVLLQINNKTKRPECAPLIVNENRGTPTSHVCILLSLASMAACCVCVCGFQASRSALVAFYAPLARPPSPAAAQTPAQPCDRCVCVCSCTQLKISINWRSSAFAQHIYNCGTAPIDDVISLATDLATSNGSSEPTNNSLQQRDKANTDIKTTIGFCVFSSLILNCSH